MSEALATVAPLEFDSPPGDTQAASTVPTGRRAEVEAKQAVIAGMISEAAVDGLMLFDPPNLAWFTGAPLCQGIPDPADWPAIYLNGNQRWLLSGSADTQRLFDEHLDGLGFQLKEWPWHWGRERLLADLVQNRKMACDRVLADSMPFGPALRRRRLTLSSDERERLSALGRDVAHAIEATCRNLERNQTEHEVAGEIAHRLFKRGIMPTTISVAADNRASRHRRAHVTDAKIESRCILSATGQRHGLHAAAARTVAFGPADPERRNEHDAALAIAAALITATRAAASIADVIESGRSIAESLNREPDWFRSPIGHVTGWLPVERPVTPTLSYHLDASWALHWNAGVGSAIVADTWLTGDKPIAVTPSASWPIKRVRIRGETVDLPDILER